MRHGHLSVLRVHDIVSPRHIVKNPRGTTGILRKL